MEVFPDCNIVETRTRLDEIEKRKASGRIYDRIFVRHWDTWKDGRRSHLFVMPADCGKAVDVMNYLGKRKKTAYAYQEVQHGTGHAVQIALQGLNNIPEDTIVYILPGDMGLIDAETIKQFRKEFLKSNADMIVLTGLYEGKTEVKHFAQVLYENIEKVEENVKKPLEGFKVAIHYGCHYLRPSEIIEWDDPFEPTTIDEIVKVLGAESMDYDLKMECCGNPVEKSDKELSLTMIDNKLKAIYEAGANCVVVVCPACYQQYDFNQRELNKRNETNYEFPVFYLSELVALAFGFKPEELGINFHRVKPKALLETLQVS